MRGPGRAAVTVAGVLAQTGVGDQYEARRRAFFDAALAWAVPALFLECRASEAVIRERLGARHGDASDADWRVHQQAAQRWEAVSDETARVHHIINMATSLDNVAQEALRILRSQGLA